MDIKIMMEDGVETPEYATKGSVGFDLKAKRVLKLYKGIKEVDLNLKLKEAMERGYFFLRGHERVLLGTGIKVEIPEGFEMQIRSRSGSTLKRGLVVANSPGTIDSDYRGEVGIIIYNTTPFLARIDMGEALAQGVICPVEKANFIPTIELTPSDRNEGGYGSTNMIQSKLF